MNDFKVAMPTLNAQVVSLQRHGPHLIHLGVTANSGPLAFLPGQFVNLGLQDAQGAWALRPYSIASPPLAAVTLFAITVLDHGTLSPRLAALSLGNRVHLETAAAGKFTLRDVPRDAPLWAVATGTGAAPFFSMFQAGQWAQRNVTLFHGARTSAGLAFQAQWSTAPGITYRPTVTQEPGWGGAVGRVQALMHQAGPPPPHTHALVCGHQEMIAQVRTLLEGWGFKKHRKSAPGNLHTEAYW